MEFSPANHVVQLCIKGMTMDENDKPAEASQFFNEAWDKATNDFEKFIAAYFLAKHQDDVAAKLRWYETSLQHAKEVNDVAVNSALAALYANIAACYAALGDTENKEKNEQLSISFSGEPADKGPFYHGTRADLQIGDMLIAGRQSNYKDELTMNHVYFTALPNGAGLAAALAKGEGHERIYIVEPTGSFENDPNVTDKKFPGNLTRSYRTDAPLKIIGELTDWAKQTSDEVKKWRDKLANSKGDIIN